MTDTVMATFGGCALVLSIWAKKKNLIWKPKEKETGKQEIEDPTDFLGNYQEDLTIMFSTQERKQNTGGLCLNFENPLSN